MTVRKKKNAASQQICLTDISLSTGDILYKDGIEYARVAGESEALYFLQKINGGSTMPSPFHKASLIENILFGVYTLNVVNYS